MKEEEIRNLVASPHPLKPIFKDEAGQPLDDFIYEMLLYTFANAGMSGVNLGIIKNDLARHSLKTEHYDQAVDFLKSLQPK